MVYARRQRGSFGSASVNVLYVSVGPISVLLEARRSCLRHLSEILLARTEQKDKNGEESEDVRKFPNLRRHSRENQRRMLARAWA